MELHAAGDGGGNEGSASLVSACHHHLILTNRFAKLQCHTGIFRGLRPTHNPRVLFQNPLALLTSASSAKTPGGSEGRVKEADSEQLCVQMIRQT